MRAVSKSDFSSIIWVCSSSSSTPKSTKGCGLPSWSANITKEGSVWMSSSRSDISPLNGRTLSRNRPFFTGANRLDAKAVCHGISRTAIICSSVYTTHIGSSPSSYHDSGSCIKRMATDWIMPWHADTCDRSTRMISNSGIPNFSRPCVCSQ